MKKIIFSSLLVASSVFALDLGSVTKTVGEATGITAESLGAKLANVVKEKAPQTAAQAKSYCTQASTYKSFVGIAEDGMMAKAIDICAEKSSEGLEGAVNEAKESTTSNALKSATKLLGN